MHIFKCRQRSRFKILYCSFLPTMSFASSYSSSSQVGMEWNSMDVLISFGRLWKIQTDKYTNRRQRQRPMPIPMQSLSNNREIKIVVSEYTLYINTSTQEGHFENPDELKISKKTHAQGKLAYWLKWHSLSLFRLPFLSLCILHSTFDMLHAIRLYVYAYISLNGNTDVEIPKA